MLCTIEPQRNSYKESAYTSTTVLLLESSRCDVINLPKDKQVVSSCTEILIVSQSDVSMYVFWAKNCPKFVVVGFTGYYSPLPPWYHAHVVAAQY